MVLLDTDREPTRAPFAALFVWILESKIFDNLIGGSWLLFPVGHQAKSTVLVDGHSKSVVLAMLYLWILPKLLEISTSYAARLDDTCELWCGRQRSSPTVNRYHRFRLPESRRQQ